MTHQREADVAPSLFLTVFLLVLPELCVIDSKVQKCIYINCSPPPIPFCIPPSPLPNLLFSLHFTEPVFCFESETLWEFDIAENGVRFRQQRANV